MGIEESAPVRGESNKKRKDEKDYNWCKLYQVWDLHHPDECKKNPSFDGTDDKKNEKLSFADKLKKMLESESDNE